MNSISNSYKNSPNHLKHKIPLDFESVVVSVPDSHKWENVESHSIGSVPLIDMSDPNAKTLIGEACQKWGVFQIINHGVPTNLLNEVEVETFRLFSLPTQQKLCALRSTDGITGYGLPRISMYFPKLLWSEGFSMMESPADHATLLWPNQPDRQTSTVMDKCQKEMKRTTEMLMELMLESLGITAEDVEKKHNHPYKIELEELHKQNVTCIKGHKKLSHIEGSDPPRDDPKFEVWDDEDSLIMTWLWNSMTSKISRNYMFYSSVREIWENHIETYSMKKDFVACYDIESKIFNSKQGTLSVIEYYGTLNVLWIEL
ncbi:Gibberellin 3-beta-dioxygenase 1, partial [Mucuna pruriens]